MSSSSTNAAITSDQPLIAQVQSTLRQRIRSKNLPVGAKLPSMRRLSQDMGCSLGIVQMAINSLTAEGHLRSTPRKGVFVAEPRVKKRDVALVLPTLQLEQMGQIIRGVRTGLRNTGLHLMIQAADGNFDDQVHLLDHLDDQYLAGVIICPPVSDEYAKSLKRFLGRGIPTVQATHQLDDLPMDTVTADAFEMGRMALTHLLERGHRRIGLLGFASQSRTHKDRLAGVESALQEVGLTAADLPRAHLDPLHLDSEEPWLAAQSATASLLREHYDITAVVASNHHVGLGAYRAARELGRQIPEDLSLIAIGHDLQAFSMVEPAITVVENPLEKVCERAVTRLRQLIDGEGGSAQTIQLPARLIERDSVSSVTPSER